jgi:putative ABC transport system permease protein
MSLRTRIVHGLRALFRCTAVDTDVFDEVDHYVAEAAAAYRAQGLSDREARRLARAEMGTRSSVRQQVRGAHWDVALESIAVDIVRAGRRLRRAPAFAIITVVTLALGVGASTAIFSVIRPVLLQALPYPDAERLIVIADASGPGGGPIDVTFGTYRELTGRSRTLERAAVTRGWQPTLTGIGEAERLDGQSVSADYFRVLGVSPAIGRGFSDVDDQPGVAPVAIIANDLWRRRFGADKALVGRTITLDGSPVLVIGIMPETFENIWNPPARIWRPLGYDRSLPTDGREWGHHLQLLARLAPGIDLKTVRAELTEIARTPTPQFTRPRWASLSGGLMTTPLQEQVTAHARPALVAVTLATVLLLLIAVVNVVNMVLARGADRRDELVTCAAFGASRVRLQTPLVAEGLLLAVIGGALGIALAYAMVGGLVTIDGFTLPRVNAIRVDTTALVFAVVLSGVIGMVASALPAMFVWSTDVPQGPGTRIVVARQRLRSAFVVAEIALAVVLLIGAGLLLRTVNRLFAVSTGFRPDGVLTLQVQTSGAGFRDSEAIRGFFDRVRAAVQAVPGVTSAALTSQLPLSGDDDVYGVGTRYVTALPPGADAGAFRYAVTSGYLDTIGIALLRGRDIDDHDRAGAQPVAVISTSVARRRFPDRNPIGEQVRLGPEDNWFTVVGIADDVKQSSLTSVSGEGIYVPERQWRFADRVMWVVLRTVGEPAAIVPAVRRAIQAVDPDQPILKVAPMAQRVAAAVGRQRFAMAALDAFAVVALILATLGVYGLLSGRVIQRTREIAVRAAIGANRLEIVDLIARQAAGLTVRGIVLGAAAAMLVNRGLTALLFEVSPLDALTYAAVVAALVLAAAIGAMVPAWRAARIAPAVALRSQ